MINILRRKTDLKSVLSKKKTDLFFLFFLFAFFFFLYYFLSASLANTNVFAENDILFEIDAQRGIKDITQFSYDHYRSNVHPVYVLFMNPPGEILEKITHSPVRAAIILNSFLGAFSVTLSYIVFSFLDFDQKRSLLLAVLFGATTSQLFLSIIPSTMSLAVCSLLVTYLLFVGSIRKKVFHLLPWILAGILTLGTTTTNAVQTLICFGIACYAVNKEKGLFHTLLRCLIFIVCVIGITAGLAILQKAVYATTVLFFLPAAYEEDISYASLWIFNIPVVILGQLFKNFFLVNIAAPIPTVIPMDGKSLPALTFAPSSNFTIMGYIGAALWLSLIVLAVISRIKWDKDRPGSPWNTSSWILTGLGLCLMFNFVLHCFYGVGWLDKIEYFLYSGHFTFLVLAIISYISKMPVKVMNYLLISLVICLLINNIQIVTGIITLYSMPS